MNILRAAGLGVLAALVSLAPAQAQVVISQVYGGGGNAGATYTNDFIEIFNRGNSAQSVNGWSVQYASAAGTTWQVTNLTNVTLQPGQYYLIKEAMGAGGTTPLPTADATGVIPMSATAGKVALVSVTTALSGACPTGGGIQDFIGYGNTSGSTANCSETAPAATLSNTNAALRAAGGCTDANNNFTDFASGAPNPRNTATTLNVCGAAPPLQITNTSPLPNGTVGQSYDVAFMATGGSGSGYVFTQNGGTLPPGLMISGTHLMGMPTTTSGSPFMFTIRVTDSLSAVADKPFQLTVDAAPTCTPTHTISQIQGSGATSPIVGMTTTTSGIATGIKSNGFFIQDPVGDGNPATSEGVFVFTSSAPPAAAAVGNSVCVTGTVAEFIPSSDPNSPPQTEISGTLTIFSLSTGNPLPAAILLTTAETNPAGAFDQLERFEGMRVQVNTLNVIAPTGGTINEANATSSSNGLFFGVIPNNPRPFREPGVQLPDPLPPGSPCCVPRFDANPEILQVDSNGQTASAVINVSTGQTVSNLIGPLDYSRRAYTINPDPSPAPTVGGPAGAAVPVPLPAATELTLASFNMERFFDTTDDPSVSDVALTVTAFNNRLNKASLAVRNVMRYPDVIGVEEMENLTTLQSVATKINNDAVAAADPNPNYQAYLVEGNDIGGIDVGLLVKTPKISVIDVTQYGKATTYINPNNNMAELLNDRPPLVLRFTVATTPSGSLPVTMIVNHLRSLSGVDDPVDGNRIRVKREAQAEYLANLIQGFQQSDPTVKIVSVGDYNAFQINDGYVDVMGVIRGNPAPANQVVVNVSPAITNPVLTDLMETAPAAQRYSYTFSGSAQELDHILVNPNMLARLDTYAVARNDADYPETYRNDANRPERITDHDMPVAYFTLNAAASDVTSQVTILRGTVTLSRLTGLYSQTVTLTNNGAPLTNVAYALDSLAAGWTLTNGSGTTSATAPSGSPYKIAGAIPAGGSVNVTLVFSRTGPPSTLVYTARVLEGTPR